MKPELIFHKMFKFIAIIWVGTAALKADSFPLTFNSIQDARTLIPQKVEELTHHPTSDGMKEMFFMCQRIPENRKLASWKTDREFKLISLITLIKISDIIRDPTFDSNNPGDFVTAPVPPCPNYQLMGLRAG